MPVIREKCRQVARDTVLYRDRSSFALGEKDDRGMIGCQCEDAGGKRGHNGPEHNSSDTVAGNLGWILPFIVLDEPHALSTARRRDSEP